MRALKILSLCLSLLLIIAVPNTCYAEEGATPPSLLGKILDQEIPKIVEGSESSFGFRASAKDEHFFLYGYYLLRNGCAREKLIANIDLNTIISSNYESIAQRILRDAEKFAVASRQRQLNNMLKETESLDIFNALSPKDRKVADAVWETSQGDKRLTTYLHAAHLRLETKLTTKKGKKAIVWCLGLIDAQGAIQQALIGMVPLDTARRLDQNILRIQVQKKIVSALGLDSLKKSPPSHTLDSCQPRTQI